RRRPAHTGDRLRNRRSHPVVPRGCAVPRLCEVAVRRWFPRWELVARGTSCELRFPADERVRSREGAVSPSRRSFLRAGAAATGVLAAGPLRALEALAAEGSDPMEALAAGNAGYGPLKAAGADLELPDGFWYV